MCRAHDKRPFYVQRMQIEEAPLCTDGDPMPGSACGGEGREGGEKSVGEGREGREGGVSLALSAITVSGGGRGHRKGEAVPVRPGPGLRGGATRLAERVLITCNPFVGIAEGRPSAVYQVRPRKRTFYRTHHNTDFGDHKPQCATQCATPSAGELRRGQGGVRNVNQLRIIGLKKSLDDF